MAHPGCQIDAVTTDLDAASFLLASLAFLLSVGAMVYTRRATKAAERSADAAARSAVVAEREEQRQLHDAEDQAVRWRPERLGNGAVKFWNEGTGTAYDVDFEITEGAQMFGGPLRDVGGKVHPGDGVRISVSDRAGGDVTITWALRPGGPVRHWVHRL